MIYSLWDLHYVRMVNEHVYEYVTSNHGRLKMGERHTVQSGSKAIIAPSNWFF